MPGYMICAFAKSSSLSSGARVASRNNTDRGKQYMTTSTFLATLCSTRYGRKRRDMLSAMRQALAERRRLHSPFLSVGRQPEAVAAAAVAASSVHLNPRNDPVGCSVWRLCRRLGCDDDVLPLLRGAGISRADDLRRGRAGVSTGCRGIIRSSGRG